MVATTMNSFENRRDILPNDGFLHTFILLELLT
jgi:hypothetical protein